MGLPVSGMPWCSSGIGLAVGAAALCFVKHLDPPGTSSGLCCQQSLHTPESIGGLLPHPVSSDQGLQFHQTLQSK